MPVTGYGDVGNKNQERDPEMELYCGVDLHSNNAVYAILDQGGKTVLRKRLPNCLYTIARFHRGR